MLHIGLDATLALGFARRALVFDYIQPTHGKSP
jgi:hypothetical protein